MSEEQRWIRDSTGRIVPAWYGEPDVHVDRGLGGGGGGALAPGEVQLPVGASTPMAEPVGGGLGSHGVGGRRDGGLVAGPVQLGLGMPAVTGVDLPVGGGISWVGPIKAPDPFDQPPRLWRPKIFDPKEFDEYYSMAGRLNLRALRWTERYCIFDFAWDTLWSEYKKNREELRDLMIWLDDRMDGPQVMEYLTEVYPIMLEALEHLEYAYGDFDHASSTAERAQSEGLDLVADVLAELNTDAGQALEKKDAAIARARTEIDKIFAKRPRQLV